MIRTLIKVVVARFYEQNAGFFLFLFFLMFGIVESSQLVTYHFSLITAMINAPVFLLLVSGFWLLYLLKCLFFIFQRLTIVENEFLFRLNLLPARKQMLTVGIAVTLIELPVLVYSLIVTGIAVNAGRWLPAFEIIVFHAVTITVAAWLVYRKLNSVHIQTWTPALPAVFRWSRPRPFPFFYLNHLTMELKTMLWVTKIFSILAIIGFLQITPDGYDVRIALLGLLFGLAAHTVIIFEFRRFEDQYLVFTRNLPLSFLRRFGTLAIVYLTILGPELVLLLVNGVHAIDALGIGFFGVGFMLILHCSLYRVRLDMDRHVQYLLAFFLLSFLLVLTRVYLVEAIFFWVLSYFQFERNFYQFEGEKG